MTLACDTCAVLQKCFLEVFFFFFQTSLTFKVSCSDVMSPPPTGNNGEDVRAKDLQEDSVNPFGQQRLYFPFSLDVEGNVGPRVLFHQGKVAVGVFWLQPC